MKPKNKDRNLLKIIKEVCEEEGIRVELLSKDWIIELSRKEKKKYIVGYNFEINTSTARMIASDKCSNYKLLERHNVPAVEHHLFLNPTIQHYFEDAGNWTKILAYFENNNKIVCKPTRGTGGKDVFLVDNIVDLEISVHQLFSKHTSIAISPFYEIENEFRVIILDGELLILYSKSIPYLIGDGEKTIGELIAEKYEDNIAGEKIQDEIDIRNIPKRKEKVLLHWQHNLGIIAKPEFVTDNELKKKLFTIATAACEAINIRFASVDIVKVGEELKVLEINSGVMGEVFSRSSPEAYELTKTAYRKVVKRMFEE